jgi:acetyl esterase/lipase
MVRIARALACLSAFQGLLMLAPPLSWPLWLLRFTAIELSLVAFATGLAAVILTTERWVSVLGAVGLVVGLAPALSVIPAYLRQDQSFSLYAWLGGGRATLPSVQHDVPLGDHVSADVWKGAGEGPRPAVFVVHGGSWRSGDKGELPHVSAALAAAGYTVLDVRYRLSGEAPWPAGTDDVRCALAAAAARADALGIDPTRFAILGRSAGGQLALDAAWTEGEACGLPVPPLRAVVAFYGVTDLEWAHDHPYRPDVVDGVAATELYLGGPPSAARERYDRASPLFRARADRPPTLLVHGLWETCVRPENSTRLEAALTQRGAPVRALYIPFAEHGFDVRPGGLGEQLARGVLIDFLDEHLARP